MLSVPPPPKRLSTLLPPSAPRVLSLAHPNATLSSTSSAATSFARYQTYFPKKSISSSTRKGSTCISRVVVSVSCRNELYLRPAVRILSQMSESFRIRLATAADANIIAWHRARMFQDMGDLSAGAFETLRTKARACIEEWLERGGYVGWLASTADELETIVGGA